MAKTTDVRLCDEHALRYMREEGVRHCDSYALGRGERSGRTRASGASDQSGHRGAAYGRRVCVQRGGWCATADT